MGKPKVKGKTGRSYATNSSLVEVASTPSSYLEICSKSVLREAVAIFTILSGVYMYTTYPTVPGGDSGELLAAACEGGVAHPPGYPLWTVLSSVVMKFYPASPAYAVNLFTCAIAALAASILYIALVGLTGSKAGGMLSTLIFSLSQLTWTWSVTAEVFALNNLFVAAILLLLVLFEFTTLEEERLRVVLIAAFTSGLAMCNQHTIALYLLPIALWVTHRLIAVNEFSRHLCNRVMLLGGLGMIPYLYLPLSSTLNSARWSWGDQTTWNGFMIHFLRMEYGSFNLAKDGTSRGFFFNIFTYGSSVLHELGFVGFVLGLLGILQAFSDIDRRVRRSSQICLLCWSVYVLFFCWRANLNTDKPLFKEVVERFWMQPHMLWCVFSSLGYKLFNERLFVKYRVPGLIKVAAVSIVVSAALTKNWHLCNHRNDDIVGKFSQEVLLSLPNDSIVLTKGDLPSGSFRYSQYCEGLRPDVLLLEQELMAYDWFIPKLRKNLPGIVFPGDRWYTKTGTTAEDIETFDMSTFLAANYQRRLFVCIGMQENDFSWQKNFILMPYGVCQQVASSPDHWLEYTDPYKDKWVTEYKRYKPGSWEEVANDEMWNAKISKAMFLWSQAEGVQDGEQKDSLYRHLYKEYRDLMSSHNPVPEYYYKNFALAAERMARTAGLSPSDRKDRLDEAIEFFTRYIETGAGDNQMPAIIEAVNSLKQARQSLNEN